MEYAISFFLSFFCLFLFLSFFIFLLFQAASTKIDLLQDKERTTA